MKCKSTKSGILREENALQGSSEMLNVYIVVYSHDVKNIKTYDMHCGI